MSFTAMYIQFNIYKLKLKSMRRFVIIDIKYQLDTVK